jgi:mono/diheme cytochrome c family protein
MNRWPHILAALVFIIAAWLIVPATASMQSPAPPPQAPASGEAVKHGEAWFYQRCSLCHMGRIVKDDTYKPMSPSLEAILKNATPDREKQVRERIQRGSQKMPGFRYNFTPAEFEELMAYLKTL